jgi:hypothetical protein
MKSNKRPCASVILFFFSHEAVMSAESDNRDRVIVLHATRVLQSDTAHITPA